MKAYALYFYDNISARGNPLSFKSDLLSFLPSADNFIFTKINLLLIDLISLN